MVPLNLRYGLCIGWAWRTADLLRRQKNKDYYLFPSQLADIDVVQGHLKLATISQVTHILKNA